MNLTEQIAEIVEVSLGALARLDAEELEAAERRLLSLVRRVRSDGRQGALKLDLALSARTKLLGCCVEATAENINVLRRLRASRVDLAGLVQG